MGMGIHCCKDCIPPKRHLGCHDTCKEYIDAKAQFEEDKKKLRESKPPKMTTYDFDEIIYAGCKRHKHRRRG